MNISLENVSKVAGLLSIKMEKADYEANVKKALNKFCKVANVPGFRKGKVPMAYAIKVYGTEAKAEEVNKLLSEKIYEFIKENKVNMLGEPLASDKQADFDIATEDSFEFLFDIAIAPEFKAEISDKDTIEYYDIEVSDDMVSKQVNMYTQRAGSYEKAESYEPKDMLKGLLAELGEDGNTKEGGLQIEGAIIMPEYFKNDDQKKLFEACKVNDVITFNPTTAYDGFETEIAALLKIEKTEISEHNGNFTFQVEEVTRFKAAELNQAVFDQVFGEGNVKSEEEFRAKIKEELAQQFVADSDYKFLLDVRTFMCDRVGKLEYADDLMKRIMLNNNKEKGMAFVEENYENSLKELTWHLIKEQLVKEAEIKIENEDLKETAKEATKFQFAQYGMMNVPEELLENYAAEMLKKKEQVDGLVNRCIDKKLSESLKNKVQLNKKSISVEDFNKMFE